MLAEEQTVGQHPAIQARNDIEVADPAAALEAWDLFDGPANAATSLPALLRRDGDRHRQDLRLPAHHLRAVAALRLPEVHHRGAQRRDPRGRAQEYRDHRRALPRALQQPALRALRLRREEGQPAAPVRHQQQLQILVINIDAFRKNFTGTEDEQKSNVIYKESDKLSGRQPIEFVQAARPIVIIDEPQSVDSTDKAQEAIKALNPLCTLRYSATHRNPYNLVYRLDPGAGLRAAAGQADRGRQRRAEGAANDAFVRVEQIDYKKGIKAKLRIHVQTAGRAEGEVGHRQERGRPVHPLE